MSYLKGKKVDNLLKNHMDSWRLLRVRALFADRRVVNNTLSIAQQAYITKVVMEKNKPPT